ncbi:MAG: hypothetical protein LBD52_05340 [Prevotellaceae bacterium]|jgi:hypothetical protein|nr:hypothetical protein [Prevotellaceae bacterium]
MKSKLLLFLLLCCYVSSTLYAQQGNGVIVSGFTIETDHSITFKLMWNRDAMPAVWSDTVWVFADYNNAGTMTRIPLSAAGATLTETSAPGAAVIPANGNNQGVYVVGNARTATDGTFSATVKLVPDGITFSTGQTGCAYVSNYPPVAAIDENGKVTFMGTDLTFKGTISNGVTNQQVVFDSNPYILPDGYWIKDFTDATGFPGLFSSGDPGCAVADLLVTGDGVYCADDNSILVGLAAAHAGWTYTLKNGATPVGTPVMNGTGAPQTFTFSGAAGSGIYTVAATKGACEIISNNSVKLLVNDLPATPVIVTDNVCQGSDLVFGVNSPVPGGTYTWSGLEGTTSGLGNATYTAPGATAGMKDITVTVQTSVNGIVCTSAEALGSATVVSTPLTPTIEIPDNVCQGSDLVFGVNSPVPGGTYTWSGLEGTTSGLGNATYTAPGATAGVKDVAVNVQTSVDGIVCTSAEALGSATVVSTPPTPIIKVASGICINSGDLNFVVTSSPGTFDWTGSSPGTPSVTVSPAGMATYTVPGSSAGIKDVRVVAQITQDGLVCATAQATATAEVYNLPVITGQPVSYLLVDLNNPFSLSVIAQPGSGTALSYQWKRNGSNVTNGNAAIYNAAGTVNAGGAYHVVVSNAYTCNVTSSNATIDVLDLPPTAECKSFEAGKIGSSATGSCTGFDAGAVGISLACYQFDAGNIGK